MVYRHRQQHRTYLGDVPGDGRVIHACPLVEVRIALDESGVRAALVDPVSTVGVPRPEALVVVAAETFVQPALSFFVHHLALAGQ